MNKYNIEIISERRYGEPKLQTPKALKGIKKVGSVYYSKAACPVYVTATDIYLKHRDWFSPMIPYPEAVKKGIIDASKWRKKFVYNDNFGGIVLRCEAWLRIPLLLITSWRGLLPHYGLCMALERTLGLPEGHLCGYDWAHMFEEIIKLCKPYLPHRPKLETYSSLLDFHMSDL